MLDNTAALLALRSRLSSTLSVCTSVDADVAATATGYTSTAGNFISRGFRVGMEVQPVGFAETTRAYITTLSATTMAVFGGRVTPQSAGAGRTIQVALPQLVAWENTQLDPPMNRWFVEEDWLPGPVEQSTLGAYGVVESLPQYVLRFYGVANTGNDALNAVADAVLDVFPPRTELVLSSGNWLSVRTSPAPYRGQLLQAEPGRPVVPITIPLRFRSSNSL